MKNTEDLRHVVSARRVAVATVVIAIAITAAQLTIVRNSAATPNWARKYNADCVMCHYPFPPRLNSFGQQFRWAGYRTPTEFNKDQDITKVGDFLAARATTELTYQHLKGQQERSEFDLSDITLFYAGAMSRNFSGRIVPSFSSTGSTSVLGQLQGIFGGPDSYVSIRAGQMPVLEFVGLGGLDRPTGISVPPIFVTPLTAGGVPFSLGSAQKGLEVAYVRGRGRLLGQVLNGVNIQGSGTANAVDIDPDKDYQVVYEHILDEISSGITLFYYQGTTHGLVTFTPTGAPAAIGERFDFSRLGIAVNKVFPIIDLGYIEVLGGYVHSHDNVPAQVGNNIDGNAYYAESQQVFLGPELAFYERVSFIDQNAARPNSMRKVYTVGAATRVQTFSRLAVEYTYTDNRDNQVNGPSGHSATLQFFIIW